MTYPSPIVILDGSAKFAVLPQQLVESANLVVATHPTKRGLFIVDKARELPPGWQPKRVLGNITRKTLDRLITVNLP